MKGLRCFMTPKKKIEQNRTRYKTLAFRISDAEQRELDKRVKLSGLQKQDFILKSLFHQKLVVIGNLLLYERLYDLLDEILVELRRAKTGADIDGEQLAPLRTAIELLEGFTDSYEQIEALYKEDQNYPEHSETRDDCADVPVSPYLKLAK